MDATIVEHRKYPRYSVHFKSILSPDGVHLEEGVVLDLSLGGCRVMSPLHLPLKTPLELDIRPDQHASIYVPSAVICWERDSLFGLEFKEIPELQLATLTRLLWTLRT